MSCYIDKKNLSLEPFERLSGWPKAESANRRVRVRFEQGFELNIDHTHSYFTRCLNPKAIPNKIVRLWHCLADSSPSY